MADSRVMGSGDNEVLCVVRMKVENHQALHRIREAHGTVLNYVPELNVEHQRLTGAVTAAQTCAAQTALNAEIARLMGRAQAKGMAPMLSTFGGKVGMAVAGLLAGAALAWGIKRLAR